MGCDLRNNKFYADRNVSIHAPTWGATIHGLSFVTMAVFQSTHPHGVRLYEQSVIVDYSSFQSTHPHGVRLNQMGVKTAAGLVSIHAPTWGATLSGDCVYKQSQFQSTHPHGVRRADIGFHCHSVRVSIHAPTWGATHLLCFFRS